MRKVMILASMLAMVMLAASPAMAQQSASAGDNSNINQQLCQNIIGSIDVEGGDNVAVTQYQYGDIAQENNTNVTVVQNCIQNAQQNTGDDVDQDQNVVNPGDDQYETPGDDQYVPPEGDAPGDDQYVPPEGEAPAADDPAAEDPAAGAAASAEAPAEAEEEVSVLPDTGGASLFTLGAGALLVAGGLLARRIIR